MKKIKKIRVPNFRFVFNLTALLGVCIFVIFSPIIKSRSTPSPAVKAAITSRLQTPVSKNISPPEITANGVYILEIDSDTILFEKNSHLRLKPASLTKIMTAQVAMDHFEDDTVLSIINGQNSNGNTADLQAGDSFTASDLLFALLIQSGNDAAVTFAENYPGGYQAFIKKMNMKATEMGLQNTYFKNVSGVESLDHYTSAYDITQLTKSALQRPQFSRIVQTKQITLESLQGNQYSLENTNLLLGKSGVLGVKTGWTPEAGECLVVLVEKDSHRVIISLLGSEDRFGEAQKLIDWVFENYFWE